MRLLIIGGAGRVGGIIRPALEAEHECRYFDVQPVPGAEDRTTVGDLNDDDALRAALADVDTVVYAALGRARYAGLIAAAAGADGGAQDQGVERRRENGSRDPRSKRDKSHGSPDAAFDVNVKGLYRALYHSLDLGVGRFVHSSTMSVYSREGIPYPMDETHPPDAWGTYGLSKRLAEQLCEAASGRYPDATILALRLLLPTPDDEWPEKRDLHIDGIPRYPLGPEDTRRLYTAAVRCEAPGFHALNTTGDVEGHDISHQRAKALLGWQPRGE